MRIFTVDAFTGEPFAGNPAAVCLLEEARDQAWMQSIASEMNLSETAFLRREGDAWRLRWFTPRVEVTLCGHATLASAHVLMEEEGQPPPFRFLTLGGELCATRNGDWIELDFPALFTEAAEAPPQLTEGLGVVPVFVGLDELNYLVEVESEEMLRGLRPDFGRLADLKGVGVIATSRGDRYDFVSRYFCPGVGIDEDPVTGSAHCTLAPYWGKKLGRTGMTAFQASERGGVVKVRHVGERVILAGQAVTILCGVLS